MRLVAQTPSHAQAVLSDSALWAVTNDHAADIGGTRRQHVRAPRPPPELRAPYFAMVISASIPITKFHASQLARRPAHHLPGLAPRLLVAAASGLMAG